MAQNTPQAISVDIYDQVYQLRGVEPEHIRMLAAIVDSKMRNVAAHGITVDSLRVAVLAALNITDELVQTRKRYDELVASMGEAQSTYRNRSHELNDLLDEVLAERVAV